MSGDSLLGKSAAVFTEGLDQPDALTVLAVAVAFLVFIIILHGWALNRVSKFFSEHFALYTENTSRWRVSILSSSTVAMLASIHLIETLLWTMPLVKLGIIKNNGDAYYFVLETYTTLGEGNVILPIGWRLLGPVIAISGLFTFGWTASVLVYVMNQVGNLHSHRARVQAKTTAKQADTERMNAHG